MQAEGLQETNMRIWIDCEFNESGGQLISMALVAEDGCEWYYALPCANPKLWVAQHVMPVLRKEPVDRHSFALLLHHWLSQFSAVHIVADWPEDIAYFCQSLVVGPGTRIDTPPLTLEVRRDLDLIPSGTPHNALADAWAIRDSHLAIERSRNDKPPLTGV
jgi:hypothetical protein